MSVHRLFDGTGGFADVPVAAVDHSGPVSIEYARLATPAAGEAHVLLRGVLLVAGPEAHLYSCGGLPVRIHDTRGGDTEELLVRLVDTPAPAHS